MDVKLIGIFYNKKIRFHIVWSLVFSFCILGCSETKKEDQTVVIQWKDNRAQSLLIPKSLLTGIPDDSISNLLQIQLYNSHAPILGDYRISDEVVEFQPLIAFTRGLKYEVRLANKLVSQFDIPLDAAYKAPDVIAVYPSPDSLPLNLLKIHISFSKPMQEGQALKNITVIKNRKDTIPSIFLDLDQELWNNERTILTLWLDPGRIKRDLQPNKNMGSPLQKDAHYQLVVNKDWRDTEGGSLTVGYRKEFTVGTRDNQSPDPDTWTIHLPKTGSNDRLMIGLHESLDYVLLTNTIRIVDVKGNIIRGSASTSAAETIFQFTPSSPWKPGDYSMEIESRLEDLAGNNLNRLFDRDITKQTTNPQKEVYKKSFRIQ